jgi:RNA polymerase sigma-70 factor (ECF subfamily)
MTDDELLARVRAGDQEALAALIEGRRAQLLAHIERQLSAAMRRKVEPEDVLQEVTADALRSLEAIDLADRDPFRWLCQLVQRRIVDAHRRLFGAQKRAASREISLQTPLGGPGSSGKDLAAVLAASITSASKAFNRRRLASALLKALEKLPEEQREALRLRYMEGLPSREIAAKLGKSDGAVRVMLTRAVQKLQALMSVDE